MKFKLTTKTIEMSALKFVRNIKFLDRFNKEKFICIGADKHISTIYFSACLHFEIPCFLDNPNTEWQNRINELEENEILLIEVDK